MLKTSVGWAEHAELVALFFLQAMATGMWMVPLGPVLNAHGLSELRPYAYATSAIAALVSPLIFGAMADRHAAPVRVLGWLATACAITMTLASFSIGQKWPPGLILVLIQVYAICTAPTGSIASTIVFSRLLDSQRQFGPLRATATFGWMCGCWLVSSLNADASEISGYGSALTWLILAAFTRLLPAVPPPPPTARVTFRERMGWDALGLLRSHDHRGVFVAAALFSIPLSAFYPFTPQQLQGLGLKHTSAWMSLGQVTEIIAMLGLAGLFAKCRLKWIFAGGIAVGIVRYALCAMNQKLWVLVGVTLHGWSFTLYFITAQIYLNERVEPAWRARAQALMWLMYAGVGNLIGYLATGFWLQASTTEGITNWSRFWGWLAAVNAIVLIYFLLAYRGQSTGLLREPGPKAG